MSDARMMGSWVLALFLAAMFLWIADQSLFPGDGQNVVFPMLAEKSESTCSSRQAAWPSACLKCSPRS